nr:hypothetical protein [Bacillus sp. Marseille-P3661]
MLLITLSGCLYPQDRLSQNQVPYKDQIQMVQNAVNQFQENEGGILPIKTKDSDTPIYQKYLIDFNKLSPRYISEPPGSAFESGGIFQYVLVDVESDPKVKLIDLTSVEVIRELKLRINFYREKHSYPPYKEKIAENYFTVDYEELGYGDSPPYVKSPYSQKNLPLFIDTQGEIYIDYAADLYAELQKNKTNYQPGDDIRGILVSEYDFVPAYSVPYTIKDNEPIFLQ